MDANEKNLSVAMNLLEGILAKSRIERDATKSYLIYFPVFDEEDGKILAKFPIFEKDGMEATLKGWQVYNLDDYRLDAFLLDNQNIVFDDYNSVNFRNPEDVEKLMYFINIFLKVQEFKKTGRGIDVVPENKARIEDLIGDFENNIVDNISEDVNRIYNYEIEYEDEVETDADASILDSIDSLEDYEENSAPVVEEVEEEFEDEEIIEEEEIVENELEEDSVLPGMSFDDETEDDSLVIEEVEDENVLPGMNFDDVEDDEFTTMPGLEEETTSFEPTDLTELGSDLDEFSEFETEEVEEDPVLPGMGFEFDEEAEDDEFLVDNTEEVIEDEVEEDPVLPGMGFEFDEEVEDEFEVVEETEEVVEDEVEEDPVLPGMGFEFDEEAEDEFEDVEETEEIIEDEVEEESFLPSLDEDPLLNVEVDLDEVNLEDVEEIEEIEEVVEDEEDEEEFEEIDEYEDDDFDDIPTIDDLEALADQEDALNAQELEETEEVEEDILEDDVDAGEALDLVVGMSAIKDKIAEYQRYVEFVKTMNLTNANVNMAFVGNKGTGKSVIADAITEILFDMDMISANKLIKVNKKELCGGHHRGLVVDNIIDTAMGGILLIDEVCRCEAELCPEVTSKLVEAMDAGLVVIFSGCNKGVNKFMNVNKELASKVAFTFDFPDYTSKELAEIIKFKVEFEGFDLTEDAEKAIVKLMEELENAEGVDARFTSKVFQTIVKKHAANITADALEIEKEDIPVVSELLDYVLADDKKVVSEVVKSVYSANTKLVVSKDDMISVLKTKEDCTLETKSLLVNKLTGLLVGMAAEEIYFGEYTNNSRDLKEATCIAKYIVENGMSDLGMAKINKHEIEMTKAVYEEANKILAKCFADAKAYVTKNKNNIDNVIEYVRKHKEVDGATLFKEFENKKVEKKVEKKEEVKKVATKKAEPKKAEAKKTTTKKATTKKETVKKTDKKVATKKAKK